MMPPSGIATRQDSNCRNVEARAPSARGEEGGNEQNELYRVTIYIYMKCRPPDANSGSLLKTLAEFRYELRRFLHFSESAALEAGLQPQQHQLLLQVAGAPRATVVTIAYAAERLGLKHNSTVELVDRSEREGLLERTVDTYDRRRTILLVTDKGKTVLGHLAGNHARELNELAPRLARALEDIRLHSRGAARTGAR